MTTGRWVFVTNGAGSHYQFAIALHEANMLEALVNSWYSKLDHPLMRGLSPLLPQTVMTILRKRHTPLLPHSKVVAYPHEFILGSMIRGLQPGADTRLGRRAGTLARERGAGILAANYYAHSAFTAHRDQKGKAYLMYTAHPQEYVKVLREEILLVPDARESLEQEPELEAKSKRFDELAEAPLMADLCIVPSSYVGRTLVENGVSADRIVVIPHGVDLDDFYPAPEPPADPFRVLFVGQLIQRKGLSYLLEAWKRLALPGAELVLVGRGPQDDNLLRQYAGQYRLTGSLNSRALMREMFQRCHLCVVPSLIEGFGMVYLESMASGTPVIGTVNSGAADVVTEGADGFVVQIRDIDALMEKIRWSYEHRKELTEMRAAARRKAESLTWSAVRSQIARSIREWEGRDFRPVARKAGMRD